MDIEIAKCKALPKVEQDTKIESIYVGHGRCERLKSMHGHKNGEVNPFLIM